MLSFFKRLFIFLLLISVLGNSFAFNTNEVSAANCTVTYNGKAIPDIPRDSGDITINFESRDILGGLYRGKIIMPHSSQDPRNIRVSADGKGSYTIKRAPTPWEPGPYEVYFIPEGVISGDYDKVAVCKGSFTIKDTALTSSTCSLGIENPNITPEDDVNMVISGSIPESSDTGFNTGGYDVLINGVFKFVYSTGNPPNNRVNLLKYPAGDYKVELRQRCGPAGIGCIQRTAQLICSPTAFRVVGRGQTGGGEIKAGESQGFTTKICTLYPDSCSQAGGKKCPVGTDGIMTAIGCVPSKPEALVAGLLKYTTLAAGGIAFIIMLLAAIQMITAEGNPEAIKHAQERFYSAIIGLLLVIFATLLMQVIGVDILGLPGFGPRARTP